MLEQVLVSLETTATVAQVLVSLELQDMPPLLVLTHPTLPTK